MARKSRIEPVREYLSTELKWNQILEESRARDKEYGKAGHYRSVCIMLEKAIELCGESKPKEVEKENV